MAKFYTEEVILIVALLGISWIFWKKIVQEDINSILQCKFPPFKQGMISPVLKSGDQTIMHWRPVTILSTLRKHLEKVINKKLKNHLISNGLIST